MYGNSVIMKAGKESLLSKAIKRSFAMTDLDRRKQLSRKGVQFLVDCFLGSVRPRDYDRTVQQSIEEFFNYERERIRNDPQKIRRVIQTSLDILNALFPTHPPILPGITVVVPDVEDVDVISASDRFGVDTFLCSTANTFDIKPTD